MNEVQYKAGKLNAWRMLIQNASTDDLERIRPFLIKQEVMPASKFFEDLRDTGTIVEGEVRYMLRPNYYDSEYEWVNRPRMEGN